jgi:hypothetical protein
LILFGEGDIAVVTREALRRAEKISNGAQVFMLAVKIVINHPFLLL